MHGTQRLSGPLADGAGLKAPTAVLQADEMNGQEYKKEELTDMCKPEVLPSLLQIVERGRECVCENTSAWVRECASV